MLKFGGGVPVNLKFEPYVQLPYLMRSFMLENWGWGRDLT